MDDFGLFSTNHMEEYYKKFIDLQEKLRRSEEQRLQLEIQFNEMMQSARDEDRNHHRKLRAQYKRFLEEDRLRQERNEAIIRALERVEARATALASKTDRFNLLRRQYQSYLKRICTKETSEPKPSVGDLYEHPAVKRVLEKGFLNREEKDEDVVERYLRSVVSCGKQDDALEKAREFTLSREYLEEFRKDLQRDVDVSSAADEVMGLLQAKKKETVRNGNDNFVAGEGGYENGDGKFDRTHLDTSLIASNEEKLNLSQLKLEEECRQENTIMNNRPSAAPPVVGMPQQITLKDVKSVNRSRELPGPSLQPQENPEARHLGPTDLNLPKEGTHRMNEPEVNHLGILETLQEAYRTHLKKVTCMQEKDKPKPESITVNRVETIQDGCNLDSCTENSETNSKEVSLEEVKICSQDLDASFLKEDSSQEQPLERLPEESVVLLVQEEKEECLSRPEPASYCNDVYPCEPQAAAYCQEVYPSEPVETPYCQEVYSSETIPVSYCQEGYPSEPEPVSYSQEPYPCEPEAACYPTEDYPEPCDAVVNQVQEEYRPEVVPYVEECYQEQQMTCQDADELVNQQTYLQNDYQEGYVQELATNPDEVICQEYNQVNGYVQENYSPNTGGYTQEGYPQVEQPEATVQENHPSEVYPQDDYPQEGYLQPDYPQQDVNYTQEEYPYECYDDVGRTYDPIQYRQGYDTNAGQIDANYQQQYEQNDQQYYQDEQYCVEDPCPGQYPVEARDEVTKESMVVEETAQGNVMKMLDTDTESAKEEDTTTLNDSDFDVSNS